MRAWLPALVASLVLLVPEASDACAVCFSGEDENREAFTNTTILLTFLPLVMIGSVVGGIWRRSVRLNSLPTSSPVALEQSPPEASGRY